MTRASALHGRLKVAAIAAVEACGSVEGAGATAGRSKTTAGRWHNVADADLPTIEAAVLMDQVAVARGDAPPIATAIARELGRVLVTPPTGRKSRAGWHGAIADLSTEHADLLSGLLRDLADRTITAGEAEARRRDVGALLTVLVGIDRELLDIVEGGE